MKNGVECYKDFFPYFKALKTNCAHAWNCRKKYTLLVKECICNEIEGVLYYIHHQISTRECVFKHWKAIELGVVMYLALFGHDICPFDLRFCAFMAVWVSF